MASLNNDPMTTAGDAGNCVNWPGHTERDGTINVISQLKVRFEVFGNLLELCPEWRYSYNCGFNITNIV